MQREQLNLTPQKGLLKGQLQLFIDRAVELQYENNPLALQSIAQAWQLKNHANPEQKAWLHYLKAYECLLNFKYKEAFNYLEQAEAQAESSSLKCRIYSALGIAYYQLRKPERSFQFFQKAIETSERKIELVKIYINLAWFFDGIADHENAIRLLYDAKEVNDSYVKDDFFKALILSYLGNEYSQLGVVKQAISYLNQAESLFKKLGDQARLLMVYVHWSDAYRFSGDYPSAITWLNKAKALKQRKGLVNPEAEIDYRLGLIECDLANLKNSHEFLAKALMSLQTPDVPPIKGRILLAQAEVYYRQNAMQKAKSSALQSIAYFNKMDAYSELEKCYEVYGRISNRTGDLTEELRAYKQREQIRKIHQQLKSSHTTFEITNHLKLLHKEKEIELLQQQNDLQGQLINKANEVEHQLAKLSETNKRLSVSEANFRALFESTNQISVQINENREIVAFNENAAQAAEKLLKKKIVKGMPVFGIIPPKWRKVFLHHFAEAVEGKNSHHQREVNFGKESFWFDVHYFPIIIDGKKEGVFVNLIDVTRTKRYETWLKHSENLLSKVQRVVGLASWSYQTDTQHSSYSDEVFKIHNVEDKSGEFNYQRHFEYVHPEDLPKVRKTLVQLLKAEITTAQLEYRLVFADNEEKWILAGADLEFGSNGEVKKVFGSLLDITALKETEQKLAKVNDDLRKFAYTVSHDLKEPLRMVNIYTDLLIRKNEKVLEGRSKKYVAFIVDAVKRMQQLLTDILQYSTVENKAFKIEKIDLNEVLTTVQENLSASIVQKGAIIHIEPLPQLEMANFHAVQLFQNLLGNAIKFSGEAKPEVKIGVRDKKNHYLFSVEDNGIGIEDQYAEEVFDVFKRLHAKKEYGGTGLGLSICKKIVQVYDGKIWVEPAKNGGSCFHFSISKG